jgi:outer membrane protein
MKKNFWPAVILAAALAILTGCGRTGEFGYVDMQRIMQESPKVKEMREQITQKVQEFQTVSEQEKKQLSAEEFAQKQQLRQSELMAYNNELDNQFKALLSQAMETVSREKKLGAVLIKDSVLQGGVDVTDEILKKLE